MKPRDFFETMSKTLTSELNRLLWNKDRTINSYSASKGKDKLTFMIEFSLKPPYSDRSSILIIVRFNGTVEKWVSVWGKPHPEKMTPINLFENAKADVIGDQEVKGIAKQLLKEIDG
jgi:hypothetical protein